MRLDHSLMFKSHVNNTSDQLPSIIASISHGSLGSDFTPRQNTSVGWPPPILQRRHPNEITSTCRAAWLPGENLSIIVSISALVTLDKGQISCFMMN